MTAGGEGTARASRGSSVRYVLGTLAGNPQLRRVQAAFVTHNCGEYASWVAMLVYAYAQGGLTESGIVATAMLVPSAVLAPVMAALTHRFALGTSLIAAYVAQAATNAAVAAALFADAPKLVVYALLVGPAVAFTMIRPTQSALTPGLARRPEELTATNVVSGWIESWSIFAAPALTGLVLALGSEAIAFVLVAVGCLGGALLVAPLRGQGKTAHEELANADDSFVGSLAIVRGDPQARLLLLLLGAEAIAVGALDVLVVELGQGALDRGAGWVGYLTAAFGAGGILAMGVTARLVGVSRLAPSILVSLAIWGMAFVGLAALPGAVGALVLLAAAGGARATFDVAGRTLLQRMARPDLLARVFGLLEGVQMSAFAVGSILAPLLVWIGGLPLAFACVAGMLPLFVLVAGRRLLDIDRHATVPVVEVALLRSMPLFTPLPPSVLESLARSLEPISAPAGVDVIREGDRGDRYYVIADGEVDVIRDGQIAATRGRGEGFGEIALMYDVPRTATVRTRKDSHLYALERDVFLVAVTGHPSSQRTANDMAAARLRELDTMDDARVGRV